MVRVSSDMTVVSASSDTITGLGQLPPNVPPSEFKAGGTAEQCDWTGGQGRQGIKLHCVVLEPVVIVQDK